MAASRITECATCLSETSLIITCQSEQHAFCQDCVMNYFRSRIDTENTVTGLETGLSCPLSNYCGSQLEYGLVRDILAQTGHAARNNIQRIVLSQALRRNVRINCPNDECSYFVIEEEGDDFQDLFIDCPKCFKTYCLTCKHSLSAQGYRDHICPPDKDITDTDANLRLHEVLTEAISVRCPNRQCSASNGATLAVKDPGDCNTMRCHRCGRFFCFICSRDLGRESYQAHQAFPHRNVKMTEARPCWLFNDEEQGNTDEIAIQIRQSIAVRNYLFSLEISDERKARLLHRNRRILGDLHSVLTETLEFTKVKVSCVIA